jgi:hypothetical protein
MVNEVWAFESFLYTTRKYWQVVVVSSVKPFEVTLSTGETVFDIAIQFDGELVFEN